MFKYPKMNRINRATFCVDGPSKYSYDSALRKFHNGSVAIECEWSEMWMVDCQDVAGYEFFSVYIRF